MRHTAACCSQSVGNIATKLLGCVCKNWGLRINYKLDLNNKSPDSQEREKIEIESGVCL